MAADSDTRPMADTPATGTGAEAETFDSLYDRYGSRALRLAGLLCGQREQAEDTVAEAFVRVLPKWRAGRIDDFWAYLRATILNEVSRGHRRSGVATRWRHRTHRPDAIAGHEELIAERDRVAAALDGLPARQRTAVILRFFEDLSEQETAELMGCAVGTVKSTTARGAARLRELLSEEDT